MIATPPQKVIQLFPFFLNNFLGSLTLKTPKKDSLYQELLLVKQQLDTANPRNAVDMKKRLDMVNELLINALESSSRLDTKLKSVIDTSKQAMVAVKDENTMLRSSLDELKEKHQGQLEGLQTKLNEFNNTHLLLFHDDDDQDGNLQDKIKRVLTCNEKQTEEMKTLKSQIESLQMKAENDAMTMANQEIKLESCTTQIRDLQAENMRLLAENDACSILKKTLESTKEENLELQSNAQAAQTELLTLRKSENVSSLLEARLRQELTDMEAASKAFMDENETIQQENTKLIELVQSLEAKVTELSSKDEQDELMRMHTRAQLGLIEYLEGEENVPLAMAKFKKQLEAEMREFALASH